MAQHGKETQEGGIKGSKDDKKRLIKQVTRHVEISDWLLLIGES